MKLFLFDIDGTLLLSDGAGKRALNLAYSKIFNEEKKWITFNLHGLTDIRIVRQGFIEHFGRDPSDEEIQEVIKYYTEYLPQELEQAKEFCLMPGVKDVLETLSNRSDCALGLATGNFEKTGFLKLAHGKIDHYFHFGGFCDDHEDRFVLTKRGVEKGIDYIGEKPETVYVIGDTVYDVRCGKAAGAKVIAVATGPVGVEVLREEKAEYVLENLRGMGALGLWG